MKNWKRHLRMQDGLTRLELLAVLGVLALLSAIALPVLAGGKPRSDIAVCANNLRQLGVAALGYSMEHDGRFPPRTLTNRWPENLRSYYGRLDALRCPADPLAYSVFSSSTTATPAERAPRSYLVNGWNDYFELTLSSFELQSFKAYSYSLGMPESAIASPSQTILFGEKFSTSFHFAMDLFQYNTGNDVEDVEHARHNASRANPRGGGSNHAMADGSVRMLSFGEAFAPINLWGVTDLWRTNSISLAP